MALALLLCIALPTAVPVMAEHGGDKLEVWDPSDGHPGGVYLVGQTVYYLIEIINYETQGLEIETLWDKVPVEYGTLNPVANVTRTYWWDDSTKEWVDEDPETSFVIPGGESWDATFNYTIREQDVSWHPLLNGTGMINRFLATGAQGQGVGDTKTVRVIQPDIELEKTVAPSMAVPGQNVTYTFTITNTGDWPLEDITLVDDELGNLTGELPTNLVLNATGQAGDSYSFDYVYTIQAGDLPLVNTATVEGTAQDFSATIFPDARVSDNASARVTSGTPPVGGTAYPVDTLAILAPWIGAGAVIIAGVAIFVRRRQART